MAVAEMKKLKLIGLSSERDAVMDAMFELGCIELSRTTDVDGTGRSEETERRDGLTRKFNSLTFAIGAVEERQRERARICKKEKSKDFAAPKKPLFAVRNEVGQDAFYRICEREPELLSDCDRIAAIAARLTEIKAENNRLASLEENLAVFCDFPIPFEKIKGTESTAMFLGTMQSVREDTIPNIVKATDAVVLKVGETSSAVAVFAVCLKEEAAALERELTAHGFSRNNFDFPETAKQKFNESRAMRRELERETRALVAETTDFGKVLDEMKTLCDFYRFHLEKTAADAEFCKTQDTFLLEGFVPVQAEKLLSDKLRDVTPAAELVFEDVTPADNPPTLTNNTKLIAPFESVTNMYSVPSYTERDPNKFVAVFFFLFFGLMLSDAGYGLVLTVVGMILLRTVRMETPTRRMIVIITLGGISTFLWGAVLGGWFAIDDIGFLSAVQWFNPIEEPMKMLGLCLGLGVVQILFGMGLKAADHIRAHRYMDAVVEVFDWYLVFIGLGLVGLNLVLGIPALMTAGLVTMIAGFAVILCLSGYKEKGFKKVVTGFKGLYSTVNFLSDILSYVRLFGLGLATGVVGMVMNEIAGILISMAGIWLGIIPAIIVLLVGHTFNIAINLLGAYVHDCRLQFVEFFSRFYEGGGHLFVPFGSRLKYTKVKNSEEIKHG